MKRLTIKLIFILLISYPLVTYAEYELVSSNVLQRVFLIKHGDKSGSSFTIDVDNRQYLISAKHFLADLKESDTIEIFHESSWKKLLVKKINLKNPNVDIVVLAPDIQLSPAYELQPSSSGIYISQKVFFLGFPFGMNSGIEELNNYYPLPLVKGGILSGIDFTNKDGRLLYIDGQNNPGFSGGPIIFYDLNDKKLKVAGVVSAYRNQEDAVSDKGRITALKAVTNSGILFGYVIDPAIDAIKNNPIGIKIKDE